MIVAKRLKKRYDLGDETFTGNEIDTISYLKKHKEDYLLVAGVGQVLLGRPCCSLVGVPAICRSLK